MDPVGLPLAVLSEKMTNFPIVIGLHLPVFSHSFYAESILIFLGVRGDLKTAECLLNLWYFAHI